MESMDIYGIHGYPWNPYGYPWNPWIPMDSMDIHGYSKVDFGSLSYIDIENVLIQNQTFKIGLGQTTPPEMTAMTIE